jgi:hypothetical protein
MIELTRQRASLALLAVAAGLLGLGGLLTTIGYAAVSTSDPSILTNLLTAAGWLRFGAALTALVGVGSTLWARVLSGRLEGAWEVGAVTAATVLIAIGTLVAATEIGGNGNPDGGDVVVAVGIGGWAVTAVAVAAVRSLAEHQGRRTVRTSDTWLGAAGGVLLLAVATGITSPSVGDATPGIVAGSLTAVALAVLAGSLVASRTRGVIGSPSFSLVEAGLALLVIAAIASAVGVGIAFSATGTLTDLRVGLAIPAALGAVGYGLLGGAATRRLAELPAGAPWPTGSLLRSPKAPGPSAWPGPFAPPGAPGTPGTPSAPGTPGAPGVVTPPAHLGASGRPTSPGPTAPPGGVPSHCGVPLPAGAAFCPRCGVAVGPAPGT